MNGARKKFFAGAAFAEQENGSVGRSDSLKLVADSFHRSGFADDARETIAGRKFLTQDEIFAQQFLLASGAFDKKFQMIEIDRFLDEIKRALLHRRDRFFNGAKCGEQNDGDGWVGLFGLAQNVETGRSGHF